MVKVTDAHRHTPAPVQRRGRFSVLRLALWLALLPGLLWGGVPWSNTPRLEAQATVEAPAPNAPQRVTHLTQIPTEFHRRAAQHLEEMRGTDMAPGWEHAAFGEDVRILFRPDDLQSPAYYEIPVVIPWHNNAPAGFIILSANENDFPIAHWDFLGEPPTHILDEDAENLIQAYYKLDTLSYVAEDTKGDITASLGQIPPKIEGMQMAWLDQEQELGESVWIPDDDAAEDEEKSTISGTLVYSGTVNPPIELEITEWESWDELKDGYEQSYGVFLEQQRREAGESWRGELADIDYGIVLFKEQVYDLAMLWPEPAVVLDGPGLDYISTQTVSQDIGLPELLRITVADSVPFGFTPFTATITYGNSVQETVRFQILEEYVVYLPLVLLNHSGGATATSLAVAAAPSRVASSWSAWNVSWAGTHDDQRLYRQIRVDEDPNDSRCPSGCGATAWAMLFGWADYQAHTGNPYWAGRVGLYRQDGGYTGAHVVAPRTMDAGARNMTWEIRERINTFCIFGNGATVPGTMGRASGYLAGRTGARLSTNYNSVGIPTGRLRERARDSIVDRKTPAIIGTGWLNHYPLAYGYRSRSRRRWWGTQWERQFYVNQGWGGTSNGWVSASTWFAGQLWP